MQLLPYLTMLTTCCFSCAQQGVDCRPSVQSASQALCPTPRGGVDLAAGPGHRGVILKKADLLSGKVRLHLSSSTFDICIWDSDLVLKHIGKIYCRQDCAPFPLPLILMMCAQRDSVGLHFRVCAKRTV